ncbi:hypothetical protein HDU85_007819 [Gaertneriomyces sp. JEL0708]|nr:hypothetical protein HDU85_007819 [Gaertneriomyces sp. JEL0708]
MVAPSPPFTKQDTGVTLGRTDTLLRHALCQKFMGELMGLSTGRAIIHAAPGSGKTSFGILLCDYIATRVTSIGRTQFQRDFDYELPVLAHYVSLRRAYSGRVQEYLSGAAGTARVIHPGGLNQLFALPAAGLKLVIIDEAQIAYENEWRDLWTEIISIGGNGGQSSVYVVLLSAYGRRVFSDLPPTPITFGLSYNGDFLKFSLDEVRDLYARFNTLLEFPMPADVTTAIYELTDGIPLLVTDLYQRVRQTFKAVPAADVQAEAMRVLTSRDMINYVSSPALLLVMHYDATAAGGTQDEQWKHANDAAKRILMQAFQGDYLIPPVADPILESVHGALAKCGILEYVDDNVSLKFSCPLQAMRTFITLCGSSDQPPHAAPTDLKCYAEEALWNLNPGVLRNSLGVGVGYTPLERTWQMEVYRAMTEIVSVNCLVSPDVGWSFGINGYVDFYICGRDFRWMVELLREGRGLAEHAGRFRGQGVYARIPHDDYLVLDFYALGPWNIPKRPHDDEHVWRFGYFQDFSGGILTRKGSWNKRIMFRGTPASRLNHLVAWLTDTATTFVQQSSSTEAS